MKTIPEFIKEETERLRKRNTKKEIIIQKIIAKQRRNAISKIVKNNNMTKKDMISIFKDIFKGNI